MNDNLAKGLERLAAFPNWATSAPRCSTAMRRPSTSCSPKTAQRPDWPQVRLLVVPLFEAELLFGPAVAGPLVNVDHCFVVLTGFDGEALAAMGEDELAAVNG